MKHLKAILVALFILFLFILAVQNFDGMATPVTFRINLIFIEYESSAIPLALVAVITFIIGLVFMGLYRISETFRLRGQIKTLMDDIKEKDKELNSLRNLPLTTELMSSDGEVEVQ
ncbi:MAG: LapA family protein [Desulfobacterales bacterium]|nr:LapA family protein [Desulfobacterales bacterium]